MSLGLSKLLSNWLTQTDEIIKMFRKNIAAAMKTLFEVDDRIQIHVEHCSICRQADGKLFMHAEYGQHSWQDQGDDSEIIRKFIEETELGCDVVTLKWVARQRAKILQHEEDKDLEARESAFQAASKRIMLALAEGRTEDPVRTVRIFMGEEEYRPEPEQQS
jgi:hypothetical protein